MVAVSIPILGHDREGVTGVGACNVGGYLQRIGIAQRDAAIARLGIALEVQLAILGLHTLVGLGQCLDLGLG